MATIANAPEDFGPYTMMFRSRHLRGMRVELRPIARTTPDNVVAILYLRSAANYTQSGVGICIDGVWRKSKRGKPLEGNYYWALMVNEKDGVGLLLGADSDG